MHRLQGAVAGLARRGAVGRGRALQRGRTARHDVDALPQPERLQRVVGHQQHRPPGEEAGGELLQSHARDRVEGRERLVHEHDGPVFHQRARKRHPLAHAAGERAGERIGFGAQAHALQHREGTRPVGPFAAQARAERDVAECAEPRHEQVLLRHVGDRRIAQHVHAAGLQPFQARDDPEQARLADAARPQQAGPPAPLQGELQAVEEQRAFESEAGAPGYGRRGPIRRAGFLARSRLVSYAGPNRIRFKGSSELFRPLSRARLPQSGADCGGGTDALQACPPL